MLVAVDVVVFAGPVILKAAFQQIEWERPTKVVPIPMAGSSAFQSLAMSMKRNGRILPTLLDRYVQMSRDQIDKLALCSYSAGWGLLNEIFQIDEDRAEVDACILNDSAFGGPLLGHEMFAADAMQNRKLMVVTNTNNAANATLGIMKTARQTVEEMLGRAHDLSGSLFGFSKTRARAPLTQPSGGAWRLGRCVWLDYVAPDSPNNTGNDYTHAEHHDLAAPTWEAYLAPYFGGRIFNPTLKYILGAAAAAGGGYAAYRRMR
jgi:hypothetical protein